MDEYSVKTEDISDEDRKKHMHAALQEDRERNKTSGYTYQYDDTNPENLLEILRQEVVYRPEEFANSEKGVSKVFRGSTSGQETKVEMYNGRLHELAIIHGKRSDARYFDVHLEKNGTMNIDSQLVSLDPDGNPIRSELMPRLSQLIGIALNYYELQNIPITGIYGRWGRLVGHARDGSRILNTNLVAYKNAIKNGMSQEDAALATPTGKSACKYGYTRPTIEFAGDNGVDVVFRKPDYTPQAK